jgi:type IV secretory pathway VirB10-like protein
MKAGFFARSTGLSRDPIEEVSTPLRPAPPLAKRLNRNALTVAAVIMGMTVLTAIVLLNPAKESKATRAASENAENSPPVPARPVFLDEPLPRSVPPAPTDSGSPTTQPAVTTGAMKSAFYPPSAPSGTAPENSVTREGSSPAMAESPRQRGYQAALMSSAVSGVTRSESASNPAADSPDTPTEEQQLVTLGDSIMRSALRQSGPLPGPALSGDADRSTGLPIAGTSHQSFAAKAAEAAAKTATRAQFNPAGSPYTLRAGTLIPALLITGITSDLPGDIVGQVSRDVYDSRSQRILLIPRGSRLIGTYDNQIAAGQGRLLVAWTRLILPDGRSMQLPGLPLTDREGNSGAKGKVDNHWRRVFGNALLLSALSAGLQLSQPSQATVLSTPSAGQVAAGAVGQELSTVAMEIIKRGMSAAPTITIPAGQAFNVMLNGDIAFDEPFALGP